ncbi:DNA topoisomerase 3 [Sugiyamaella lignohabitans]|uniref:DNA topoisomerase n=1 Tax=Sugiyamaella lignohabitans TaxID=796027 RepID=A0A161HJL6_9ASCO|nr:DNA topoisomerase 3 [Sugiyamaella lignohabitans]ANB11628.1 DNA topoisomerase 3 [Sugiyamaella lignohabitans]
MGYISYPRTETDQFDSSIDLHKLIEKQTSDGQWGEYSSALLSGKFCIPRKGKHDDKAHPPIHPIKGIGEGALDADQKKVYEFVTRHFLACCSNDAKGQTTSIQLDWGGEKFNASGLVVLERNFLDVYPYIKWETNELPEFELNQVVAVDEAMIKDGQTSPPSHLTEPELIALMDANGIGTDATMAEHIEKIILRGYVVKHPQGGRNALPLLIPSNLGIGLVDAFDEIGFDMALTKPFLRKETEDLMQKICDGQLTKDQFLQRSIEQYRNAYALATQNRNNLVRAVKKYF